jgi:hypothetical protein
MASTSSRSAVSTDHARTCRGRVVVDSYRLKLESRGPMAFDSARSGSRAQASETCQANVKAYRRLLSRLQRQEGVISGR